MGPVVLCQLVPARIACCISQDNCIPNASYMPTILCVYLLEAAANTGFNITAPKCCHFPQLPGDLDGVVKQQAKLPLVTHFCRPRHFPEEVYEGDRQEVNFICLRCSFGYVDWMMQIRKMCGDMKLISCLLISHNLNILSV